MEKNTPPRFFLKWEVITISICTFLLLCPQLFAQKIKGRTLERIERFDGKVISKPLGNVTITLVGQPDISATSNNQGLFELKVPGNLSRNTTLTFTAVKNNYDLLARKDSPGKSQGFSLSGEELRKKVVIKEIYFSKKVSTSEPVNKVKDDATFVLSGYITRKGQELEEVEVKMKTMEDIHDISRDNGYFELYLPSNRFGIDQPFTLMLEKGDYKETIVYQDLQEFFTHANIEFKEFPEEIIQPVENTTPPDTEGGLEEAEELAETEKNIDDQQRKFREYIKSLDNLDFRNLSPEEIKGIKVTLNQYADEFSELKENIAKIKENFNPNNIDEVEKELLRNQKKLIEVEHELIENKLANFKKTIIILSLSLVLTVLSGITYYYFYVYRRFRVQALELDRRNRLIEFLLKELNHRVMNNLQVISSMLRRKIRRLPDDNSKNALKEIQKRVVDISKIHMSLYSKSDERNTKISTYLHDFTETLAKLYNFDNEPIKIELKAPDKEVSYNNAVFFGLVVNELFTNSMKYAYKGVSQPSLSIQLKEIKEQVFSLKIKDNGNGFPPDLDLNKTKSSGLKLVNLITEMHDGQFKMYNQNGANFELVMKMKA